MKTAIIVFLAVLSLAVAFDWQVDSGYGVGTGIATAPSEWAVLKFFPDNITIVAGDTVTWTHRSDGHVIVFWPTVLSVFADPINIFYDNAILPIPAGKGDSVANAVNISSTSVKYSSGIMGQVGQKWTARFDVPGVYFYFCMFHPAQVGFVNVLPAGQTAPKNQSTINAENAAAYAQLNITAATLSASIRSDAVRVKRSDGTRLVTIDNGYGDFQSQFSLNTFGPSETWVSVGDTMSLVIKDFAGGHTVAFNASDANGMGDYYWDDIIPLSNGSLKGPFNYFRSFGDNENWVGQFISGGLQLPAAATPANAPKTDVWNVTIGEDFAQLHTLPKRVRFICNLHTLNPNMIPGPTRQYMGQVGYLNIYPKGSCPAGSGAVCDGPGAGNTPAPGSSASAMLMSFAALIAALIALLF